MSNSRAKKTDLLNTSSTLLSSSAGSMRTIAEFELDDSDIVENSPYPTVDDMLADYYSAQGVPYEEIASSHMQSRPSSPSVSSMEDVDESKEDAFSDAEDSDDEMSVEFDVPFSKMNDFAEAKAITIPTEGLNRKRKSSHETFPASSFAPSILLAKRFKAKNNKELPPELAELTALHLDTKSLGRSTQVCTRWFGLYKTPLRGRRLLDLTMQSDYANMAKMLALPDIHTSLFIKPTLADINPIQYAIEVCDVPMLRLFIQAIKHDPELVKCFIEQEEQHKKMNLMSFFTEAIDLMQRYNQEGITDDGLLLLGKLQARWPEHMLKKIWSTIIEGYGQRAFSSALLGKEYALVCGSNSPRVACRAVRPGTQFMTITVKQIASDLEIMSEFYQTVIKQYNHEIQQLRQAVKTNDQVKSTKLSIKI